MASNPIQRRARQSFLVGFLIALIIMAVIVVFLFMKISSLNEENASLQSIQTSKTAKVYILNDDVKSGEIITSDMLRVSDVLTDIDVSNYITAGDFYDEEGNDIDLIAKTDLSGGSPILRDTVSTSDNELTDDQRIMEFNMIVLPSELENGDYIDIRFSLPNGTTYIVLSKKHVEQTTATGVWLKLADEEILMINSAIVETYQITGARLYAVQYTEPGLQEAAIETYAPTEEVINLINGDKNIVEEAKNSLAAKIVEQYNNGRTQINGYKSDLDNDDIMSSVESGNEEENEAITAAREEFVTALDGTGLVGSENY